MRILKEQSERFGVKYLGRLLKELSVVSPECRPRMQNSRTLEVELVHRYKFRTRE